MLCFSFHLRSEKFFKQNISPRTNFTASKIFKNSILFQKLSFTGLLKLIDFFFEIAEVQCFFQLKSNIGQLLMREHFCPYTVLQASLMKSFSILIGFRRQMIFEKNQKEMQKVNFVYI